ncbi:hypothetical protein PROFUN_13611 [Planoprotostelium fungivorum]|uniref:Leucine-rich repeat-containing N-terminal plant-type domain-containing protein n=1 Tax=Planoprotostelium fungivorum TaxID=1890364 RepID=A0A2P6N3N3_9EUKA|nr:hypothetical protein PROFUN_13611 [Planoprotostelium fungivorum]
MTLEEIKLQREMRGLVIAFLLASVCADFTTQIPSLTNFFQATNRSNWTNCQGWFGSDNPCDGSWYGIACQMAPAPFSYLGMVANLSLSDNNLVRQLLQEAILSQVLIPERERDSCIIAQPYRLFSSNPMITPSASSDKKSSFLPAPINSVDNIFIYNSAEQRSTPPPTTAESSKKFQTMGYLVLNSPRPNLGRAFLHKLGKL